MQWLYSPKLPHVLLRVGLAFAFLYASISSFITPSDWVGYLPVFMRNIVPGTVLLPAFSAAELLLALWLITGWYIRYAALLAAAMLAGIVVFNPSQLLITFRDVSLVIVSLALFVLDLQRSATKLPKTT